MPAILREPLLCLVSSLATLELVRGTIGAVGKTVNLISGKEYRDLNELVGLGEFFVAVSIRNLGAAKINHNGSPIKVVSRI